MKIQRSRNSLDSFGRIELQTFPFSDWTRKNSIYIKLFFPYGFFYFPTSPSSCVVRRIALTLFADLVPHRCPKMPSSGNSFYGFRFKVWQQRRSPPTDDLSYAHPHAPDEFPIEFRITEWQQIKKFVGDDDRPVSIAQTRSRTRSRTFWVPKHAAQLCDGGARLLTLLSNVGAPAQHHEAVLRDISSAAAAQSAGTGTSMIVVTLEHMTLVLVEVDDVMDIVLRESMAVDPVRPIPATRSAIERLEKVTFEEGLGPIGDCIICTEEFKGGFELTRLPCSHVYHGDCIVKWLETSHLCPLCRYPLPRVN